MSVLSVVRETDKKPNKKVKKVLVENNSKKVQKCCSFGKHRPCFFYANKLLQELLEEAYVSKSKHFHQYNSDVG